jgi:hypothetical protein
MTQSTRHRLIWAALVISILFWTPLAHADAYMVSAYEVGRAFGVASYQASVEQRDIARQILQEAQTPADHLISGRYLPPVNILQDVNRAEQNASLHGALISLRQDYEGMIQFRNQTLGQLYKLGLLIGMAEGQATSSQWIQARQYANQALNDATKLVRQLRSEVALNVTYVDGALNATAGPREAAYDAIVKLRWEYRNELDHAPRRGRL